MSKKDYISSKQPTVENTNALISDRLLRMQLANIRKSKHLTQKQVSEITGLSESCISNIESSDTYSPTMRSLMKYTSALGVDFYIKLPEGQ